MTIGSCGYNYYNNITPITPGGAAGWETDYNDVNNILGTPIQVLGQDPGGNTQIIYAPSSTGTSHHGFVFAAGSICFGGSLACDPGLQTMMKNVLKSDESYLTNVLASQFSGSTYTGNTFWVSGTFTIDQTMTFTSCTFNLAPNSNIVLTNSSSLILNNCTLQAGCDAMWDGIYADNPLEQVIITNSTLRDMINGVFISNNAKINSGGSSYEDNYTSIQLSKNTIANTCLITNNTFKQQNGLKAPYVSEIKPRYGIRMFDCNNLSIGDLSSSGSGNHFHTLSTGIYVESSAAATFTSANNYLNYNDFNNITGNASSWASQINKTSRGWAVYAFNGNYSSNVSVNVKGYPSSNTVNFQSCDKGILLRKVSGTVSNQKMDKTIVGVSMTECQGRSYRILGNSIQSAELGISKNGDENSTGVYISGNSILLDRPIPETQLMISSPTGILSNYSSTTNIGTSHIIGNTIEIPLPDKAIGISLTNGSRDFIQDNRIHLTATTGVNGITIPELAGIFCNKSESPSITRNVIDNNFLTNGNTNYVPGSNAGIYVTECGNSLLQCNISNFLTYGIFATGINGSFTDYTRTSGNTMNSLGANFMYWFLGPEGTLGQVGQVLSPSSAYNANNIFQVPFPEPLLARIFRLTPCGFTWHDKIVTTNAQLDQSKSLATTTPPIPPSSPTYCETTVINPTFPFTNTFVCPDNQESILPDNEGMDYYLAMMVAQNEIEYDDFDEGARRAHEEMIYNWLEAHDSIRLSSPVLDSFYLNRYSQIVGSINRLDQDIALLSDSTLLADSVAWATQMQLAKLHNNNLGTQQVFEANAKSINTLYLRAMEYGIDSLDQEEIDEAETLANSCPLLGGNAVFRARALIGMLNPGTHYDDIIICNSQGVYKNGNSKLQNQIKMLQDAIKRNELDDTGVSIYPNPASSDIVIEYLLGEYEQADLTFYDLLGNKIKNVKLYSDAVKRTISVDELASGLYVYHFITSSGKRYVGKLIKE